MALFPALTLVQHLIDGFHNRDLRQLVADLVGVARLFSRLESRFFRPAIAVFTANDAVLPFPLRRSLDSVDRYLDQLIDLAFPQTKAS
jgi:hypothetical protein